MTEDIEIIDQMIETAGFSLQFEHDSKGFAAVLENHDIHYKGSYSRSTGEALESLGHYLTGMACERFVNLHVNDD